jgi:peptidoglycan/LPS O-acetylase OafA/YrhL
MTKGQRLDHLDGLRALAASWVMLGHSQLFAFGWTAHQGLASPLNVLLYLHLPVDIFIVLSGFCLALPCVRNGGRLPGTASAYFRARAARILPPYYAALLFVLLVNAFVPVVRWSRIDEGLTAQLPPGVLWSNFLLLQDVLPSWNRIVGPFWSIAVEWHLYFLFPLLLVAMRRFGSAPMLAVAGVLAIALTKGQERIALGTPQLPLTFPQPTYYVFLFALGIAAAHWRAIVERDPVRIRRPVAVGCMLAALLLAYVLHRYAIHDVPSMERFNAHLVLIDTLVGCGTAVGLVALSLPGAGAFVRRLLQWRPLVTLGHASYSLYLVHIVVLSAVYHAIEIRMPEASPAVRFAWLVTVGGGGSVLLALAFAAAFERKMTAYLRGPRKIAPSLPSA